jgi:hypothetical protein
MYLATKEQLADTLTKGLSHEKHEFFLAAMGLHGTT